MTTFNNLSSFMYVYQKVGGEKEREIDGENGGNIFGFLFSK